MDDVCVAVAVGATWSMVGLIWFVQLVHYPMLAAFSAGTPTAAARFHQRRTSWVVGPLMASEGLAVLGLLVWRPAWLPLVAVLGAGALLAVALASTALVQVPLHGRLADGHDAEAAARLVRTNWVRTVAWTGSGLCLAGPLAVG